VNRRISASQEMSRDDAIRVLRSVQAKYADPPKLKVGDLVRTREFLSEWDGYEAPYRSPMIVLMTLEDLSAVTGEAADLHVQGVKLARINTGQGGIAVFVSPCWKYELLTKPQLSESSQ
jgi:hypothetical protein